MGSDVASRKDFIVDNAINVSKFRYLKMEFGKLLKHIL